MEPKKFSLILGNKTLAVETGRIAQQCSGSCIVSYGGTQVLGTCAVSREEREGIDYLPLMVNYQEKYYASGLIGGVKFRRREARPSDDKIIIGRMIDRGLRPMFPKDIRRDIQIMLTPLSYDHENHHDIVSSIAGACAAHISDCPFDGPIASVRVGMINGEMSLNPTQEAREKSDLDLVVTSSLENIIMVEAGANEIPEDKMLEAVFFGKKWAQKIAKFLDEIRNEVGKEKFSFAPKEYNKDLAGYIEDKYTENINKTILNNFSKMERFDRFADIKKEAEKYAREKYGEDSDESLQAKEITDKLIKKSVRKNILEKNTRIGGRGIEDIRKLEADIDIIARAHGSALFQRGETQAVTVTTLGGPSKILWLEDMDGEGKKRYFHHYNFPPYAVGEASNRLSTGNREIGHGNLAEKAVLPVLPKKEDFPYTIRVVTEIFQSNGSSSMAAACGSSMSLMAAGVPLSSPVSGIALGLMSDEKKGVYKILTDLQDEEDFGGDMDFKVAGTPNGITAVQMDIKIKGLPDDVLREAFLRAKKGRAQVLEVMLKAIDKPRKDLSLFAPRLYTLKVDPEQIRIVIGKGGETINKIIDETGVEIDIEDDGTVIITATDAAMADKAVKWIERITEKPEVGKIYEGKVERIIDGVGAIVEFLPGTDGLVHISNLQQSHTQRVEDVCKVGDQVKVKLMDISPDGKNRLSIKDNGENSSLPKNASNHPPFRKGLRKRPQYKPKRKY